MSLPFVYSVAILFLLPAGAFLPLMQSSFRNVLFEESRLVSSVGVIYREVWFPFAFGFLFFAFLFPAIRAVLQFVVLGTLRWKWRIPQLGRLFRWSEELRSWSMTDVVAIAGVVAYFRASIPADVEILIGGWCYFAAAVLVFIGDRTLDRRAVWHLILPDRESFPSRPMPSCDVCEMIVGSRRPTDPCPRCGATLAQQFKPRFITGVTAIGATLPLLFPAFSTAVIVNDQLTGVLEHTVIGTVQLMADRGYWQLGVVVLLAGVVIPIIELIGLTWLMARTWFPERRRLVIRTRLYRILRRLVRWPMILPFVAAIAAPIIDYHGIDDIIAGPGATPLFLAIALIILSVHVFEPRLMWRAAEVTP